MVIMARYSMAPNLLIQEIVSETVILDMGRGQYYELNETATEMMKRLKEMNDPDRVLTSMLADYDVTESELRHDLDALLARLMEHNLITVER